MVFVAEESREKGKAGDAGQWVLSCNNTEERSSGQVTAR